MLDLQPITLRPAKSKCEKAVVLTYCDMIEFKAIQSKITQKNLKITSRYMTSTSTLIDRCQG